MRSKATKSRRVKLARYRSALQKAMEESGKYLVPHLPAHDPVDHPTHYTSHPSGVECIEIACHHNMCIGSALKYLWRAGLKGGEDKRLEDLKKARWYLDYEIRRLERSGRAR